MHLIRWDTTSALNISQKHIILFLNVCNCMLYPYSNTLFKFRTFKIFFYTYHPIYPVLKAEFRVLNDRVTRLLPRFKRFPSRDRNKRRDNSSAMFGNDCYVKWASGPWGARPVAVCFTNTFSNLFSVYFSLIQCLHLRGASTCAWASSIHVKSKLLKRMFVS